MPGTVGPRAAATPILCIVCIVGFMAGSSAWAQVEVEPDQRYLLLATERTSTMQEELQEAAAQGFRLLPQTLISKSRVFGDDEIVVVLERGPGESRPRFEYRLLATTFTSTLQDEVTQMLQAGFSIAGLVSRGEHMVIMERELP